MADKTLSTIAGSQTLTTLDADDLLYVAHGDGVGGHTDAAVAATTIGGFASVTTDADDHTLALADVGTLVSMTSGSANTLTVPPNASVAFPVGTRIEALQYGAGTTTIAAGAGVTIRSRDAALESAGQYARWVLEKIATNEWVAAGDLVAGVGSV